MLVCFAFVFCHLLIFARYIKVCYTFGFLGCVRYNEDFVTSTDPLYPLSLLLFLITTLFLKACCDKGIYRRKEFTAECPFFLRLPASSIEICPPFFKSNVHPVRCAVASCGH